MRQKLGVLYRNAAREFARRVVSALGERVDAVVLYGSVARGEARSHSDVDVLVISPDSKAVKDEISQIRSDLAYETNYPCFISLVHLDREEFRELLLIGSPFARNVLTEGLALYDNGTFTRVRREATAVGR